MKEVHDALLALYERDGKLVPEQIVSEATDPSHVLHDHFTWDDEDAAHQYRLMEAGMLIRRCKITVRTSPEETVTVRAFLSRPEPRSYVPTDVLLKTEKATVMDMCLRDIEALRTKYQNLLDFDQALAKARRSRARK